jgi:glycosyltransferase involved in cell wall biosynthesis
MDKITIISVFNKHEDFIELQYNSILKHVKGDYEYIVFNNGSTEEQSNKIIKICEEFNIKCIRIHVNYNQSPSHIAGNALNESFKHLSNEIVFKMDSDMFFISDVNLIDVCNKYDLFYIETGSQYMWSGVFSINTKKLKEFNLNFLPGVIQNTDTFGQSCLLTNDPIYSRKKMFLYCILNETNGKIDGTINNDCRIIITKNEIVDIEHNRFENLYSNLNEKFFSLHKKIVDFGFPKPYHIDIITLDGLDFIIHFKSSNHDDIYKNLDYTKNKKSALISFLNDNNKLNG